MPSAFSWPVLVPYALRAPAPVNLSVGLNQVHAQELTHALRLLRSMSFWKKAFIAALLSVTALIFLVLSGLSYLFGDLGRAHESDQSLMNNLRLHKAQYELLITMFHDDAPVQIVHPTFLQPDGAITAERWDQYKKLFNQLGLDGGMRGWEGEGIWFLSTTQGLVTGGSSKGYWYRPRSAVPLFPNLDSIPADLPSNVRGFRKIDDDWYITFDWDD